MEFGIALTNVLTTLFYLVPGYILKKIGRAEPGHLPTLSSVLVYIGTPFLMLSAFLSLDYDRAEFTGMGLFFAVSLVCQALFLGICLAFIHLAGRKREVLPSSRVAACASVMGNVGFFGMPIVRAMFPDSPEAVCYSAMYMISMNLIVFTAGVFCITGDRKYMSLRSAIFTPTVLGAAISLPCYFLGAKNFLPEALIGAIKTVGGMTTPLCMIILGIRLASAPIKRAFSNPAVYAAALGKLLVFPLFSYMLVRFLPLPQEFKACLAVLSGTPCAAIILSLAEIHGKEASFSADCILVSTLLCSFTIPLLTLIVR